MKRTLSVVVLCSVGTQVGCGRVGYIGEPVDTGVDAFVVEADARADAGSDAGVDALLLDAPHPDTSLDAFEMPDVGMDAFAPDAGTDGVDAGRLVRRLLRRRT